jgi:integrase
MVRRQTRRNAESFCIPRPFEIRAVARTPRGTPPSYRRHSSGQACVTVRDPSGRRREILLGPWDSPESKREYARVLAELASHQGTSARRDREQFGPPDLTVNEVILAFWKYAEGHYGMAASRSSSTELKNLRDALRPLRELYGHSDARDFGPIALRAVRDRMIEGGLARTTINARINRIRRIFRWAVSIELISPGVIQALGSIPGLQRGRSKAKEPRRVTPVAVGDVEKTLPFLPRPVAAMVQFQLLTGCRTEEVLSMRGDELILGEPNWEYRPGVHKNAWRGQRRVIPIGPRARAILEEFVRPGGQGYLFSPRDAVRAHHARRTRARESKPTPSELARRSDTPGQKHGQRYNRRSYRQAVVRACRRAGIPAWTPLQLRHAAATIIRARFGLEAAQSVLGHARADVTQVYAERDLARAHSVMAEIG